MHVQQQGTHRIEATILPRKKTEQREDGARKGNTLKTQHTQHLRIAKKQNVRGWFLRSSFCGLSRLKTVTENLILIDQNDKLNMSLLKETCFTH